MKRDTQQRPIGRTLAGFLTVTLLTACAAPPQSSTPSTAAPSESGATPVATPMVMATPIASLPPGARIVGKVKLDDPEGAHWLAASSDSVWVGESRRVLRIDPATSAIRGIVQTRDVGDAMAAVGFGAVWESDFGRNVVYRIDVATMKVVATIPVGESPEGVAVTATAVWVANHHGGTVSRIDPTMNRVTATVKVAPSGDNGPYPIAANAADAWVFVPNLNGDVGIDAATNTVIGTLPLNGPPASDGTQIWIASFDGMALSSAVRIDPASGKVVATTPIDVNQPGLSGAAVGLGSVWVTTAAGLYRIDERTARMIGRLPCDPSCAGGNVVGAVVAGGSVWLAGQGQAYILRIAPL